MRYLSANYVEETEANPKTVMLILIIVLVVLVLIVAGLWVCACKLITSTKTTSEMEEDTALKEGGAPQ